MSLIGPGGIGKSRLAIEVAHATEDLFPDGTYFVLLEGVLEHGLLLPTIAYFLGIRDNGEAGLEERIARALEGRQGADRARQLRADRGCRPPARAAVHGRAPRDLPGDEPGRAAHPRRAGLRGRDRCRHPRAPGPSAWSARGGRRRSSSSSTAPRRPSRSSPSPPRTPTPSRTSAGGSTACRWRSSWPPRKCACSPRRASPSASRHSLPLLTASVRDLPDRHRTMQATIDWSVGLLPDERRAMLEDLGVFATRFTLEAVEAIGRGRVWDGSALDGCRTWWMPRSSGRRSSTGGRHSRCSPSCASYAIGRLKERGEADLVRVAHADYYLGLVHRLAPDLRGPGQPDAVGSSGWSCRTSARPRATWSTRTGSTKPATSPGPCWSTGGSPDSSAKCGCGCSSSSRRISRSRQHTRAAALFFTVWGEMWQRPSGEVVDGLGESERLFTESGDEDAAAMALAAKASTRLRFPGPGCGHGRSRVERSRGEAARPRQRVGRVDERSGARLARADGRRDRGLHRSLRSRGRGGRGEPGYVHARRRRATTARGWLFMLGDVEAAEQEWVTHSRPGRARLHFDEGVAYALEGMCAVAASRGDGWRAGALAVVARDDTPDARASSTLRAWRCTKRLCRPSARAIPRGRRRASAPAPR